jgi:hypothetical protein
MLPDLQGRVFGKSSRTCPYRPSTTTVCTYPRPGWRSAPAPSRSRRNGAAGQTSGRGHQVPGHPQGHAVRPPAPVPDAQPAQLQAAKGSHDHHVPMRSTPSPGPPAGGHPARTWLPYRHRDRVSWIPADAHATVTAERGGTLELAETASDPRRDETAERACERRYGAGIAQAEAPEVTSVPLCCGKKPPGRAGQPLVLACQLCSNSPTYYRRDEIDRAGPAPTFD